MDRDQVLRDILRVNHAGEYGAIRIYRAQAAFCRAPGMADFMREALADEQKHLDTFRALMRYRTIQPCHMLWFWGWGGTLLGTLTGLTGGRAILLCTVAVERTVHAHLQHQLLWLGDEAGPEALAIAEIMVEEQRHADQAASRLGDPLPLDALWTRLIAAATRTLIWLSTYGAVARMRRALSST